MQQEVDEVDRAPPVVRRPSEIVYLRRTQRTEINFDGPISPGDAVRRGSSTFNFNWRAPLGLLMKNSTIEEKRLQQELVQRESAIFDHTEDEELAMSFRNLRLEFVWDDDSTDGKSTKVEAEAPMTRSTSLEWLLREHEQLLEYDDLIRASRRSSVLPVTWFNG